MHDAISHKSTRTLLRYSVLVDWPARKGVRVKRHDQIGDFSFVGEQIEPSHTVDMIPGDTN